MNSTIVTNDVVETAAKDPHSQEVKDIIQRHALVSAVKAGATCGGIMGTFVLASHNYWPAFRQRLGISGKTALVVSAALAGFTVVSEQRILHGARDPEKYLASIRDGDSTKVKSSLKLHERAANYVYDYPFRALAYVGVPLVGGIFSYQTMNKGINTSQKIMHTRIYGQGAVVVLLLGAMGFHDYMQKRGRFEEHEA